MRPLPLDPSFNVPYDEEKYGTYLRDSLKLDHLTPTQQAQLVDLIKRKWGVFRPEGMSQPVLDYICATLILAQLPPFEPKDATLVRMKMR
jgi:hypothetical protein